MVGRLGHHVLIDGYNVIKQHPLWMRLPLAQARNQLIAALQHTRWPMPVRDILVFFDGPARFDQASSRSGFVEVIFASPTADEAIQQTIRDSPQPHQLVAVSDDRAIRDTAKSHGIACHSTTWLLERSRPKQMSSLAPNSERPPLRPTEIRRINEELAKRWSLPPKN